MTLFIYTHVWIRMSVKNIRVRSFHCLFLVIPWLKCTGVHDYQLPITHIHWRYFPQTKNHPLRRYAEYETKNLWYSYFNLFWKCVFFSPLFMTKRYSSYTLIHFSDIAHSFIAGHIWKLFLLKSRNTVLGITNLRILLSDAANHCLSAGLGQLPHYSSLFIAIGFAEIFSVFSLYYINERKKSAYCNRRNQQQIIPRRVMLFPSFYFVLLRIRSVNDKLSSSIFMAVSAILFHLYQIFIILEHDFRYLTGSEAIWFQRSRHSKLEPKL